MRADRLLSLMLLLQANGRMTAATIAEELEVSVRTIYRDLEALGAAGIPVYAEAGPGGGCQLLDGYRSPLAGLSRDEAAALLTLGVPKPLRELGLGDSMSGALRRVRSAAGVPSGGAPTLVHLDMPRWFHSREAVPHLVTVAEAVRRGRHASITYRRGDGGPAGSRAIAPLGLVNKAGVWYVVAVTASGRTAAFRVGRIEAAGLLDESSDRPDGFDLVAWWDTWSADFASTRPRVEVTVRASAEALRVLPEILGDAVLSAISAAEPADAEGWRSLTLTFEHEAAAAHRLAGFGDLIEVVTPTAVRERLVSIARATLRRHGVSPTRSSP
jgi:predicted DNA-binding transcriptional regulator YafY